MRISILAPMASRFSLLARCRSWRAAGVAFLLLVGVAALPGCSSIETTVDTGRVKGRSFAFMATDLRTVPDDADKREQAYRLIETAIANTLTSKGLAKVDRDADLRVGFLLIVGNNVSTTSLNRYFGYGPEAAALVDKIHEEQTAKTGANRNYFEAGTLVIDLLDAKTGTLVKRSTVRRELLRNVPLDVRVARLQQVVDEELSDLKLAK